MVITFKSDDFPVLVYPTIPTVGIPFLILHSLWSFLIFSYSLSDFSYFKTFSFKCLFMTSVLVSPCPLLAPHPQPLFPHCLESSSPILKILGPICLMAESSICNLDSIDSACLPNIFKIKSTLSRASAFIGRRSSLR